MAKAEQRSPFAPAPLQSLRRYYGLLRPCAPRRYARPRGWSRLRLPPFTPPIHSGRRDGAQVLTSVPKAWSSFAPPTCRDAARAVSGHPRADPGGRVTPRFLTSPNPLSTLHHRFACARLSRPCLPGSSPRRFPQRSPPRLLTAAACGGLRSAPDCRTRRALLHLSYSCAPPILMAALVTHDPFRTSSAPVCMSPSCSRQCLFDELQKSVQRSLAGTTSRPGLWMNSISQLAGPAQPSLATPCGR